MGRKKKAYQKARFKDEGEVAKIKHFVAPILRERKPKSINLECG